MTRDAQESAERARKLREHLEEVTAHVDGLVGEARSTLRRAVEFLEREGLRGTKSGAYARFTGVPDPEAPPPSGEPLRDEPASSRSPGATSGAERAPPDPSDAEGATHGE